MFLLNGCVTGEKSLMAVYFSLDWGEGILVVFLLGVAKIMLMEEILHHLGCIKLCK